jgi:hypothetical protein
MVDKSECAAQLYLPLSHLPSSSSRGVSNLGAKKEKGLRHQRRGEVRGEIDDLISLKARLMELCSVLWYLYAALIE